MTTLNLVPPLPANSPLLDQTTASGISWGWLNWFKDIRNRVNGLTPPAPIPGPYANDAAAATAGVAVGSPYYVTGTPAYVVTRIA